MNRLRPGRLVVQDRDRAALVYTYRHGFLLRDDLGALAFPGSKRRVLARRLKRLVDAGLLEATLLPLGAFPLGLAGLLPHPGQFAYRVTHEGAVLVAQHLEVDLALVRRRLQATPSYLGHAVAVARIAVAFRQFASSQSYRLSQFLCEGEARHRYQWKKAGDDAWSTEELRPDGLAVMVRGGSTIPIHIEADMATQGRQALAAKLDAYKSYVARGAHARRFPDSILRLGIVTTSPERIQTILSLLTEVDAPELRGAVYLTTFALLAAHGPLAPIWSDPTSPTSSTPTSILT